MIWSRKMLNADKDIGWAGHRFSLTPLKIAVGAFVAIGLLGALVLYAWSGITTIKKTHEAKQRATAELDRFKPMPGSVFVRRGSTAGGEHGTVTDHYRTDANYESVRDYCLREFQRLGWEFHGESKMLVRGEDIGAFEIIFCKNSERANLYFVGKQETAGNITYTLGISWGLGCGRSF
jgi:hypothetical protein